MELKITDQLAIERTKLANERTFLAYFRTGIVFSSSGFAIVKLELLEEIAMIGYFLIVLGPLLVLIGLLRFSYVKKKIRNTFKHRMNPKP